MIYPVILCGGYGTRLWPLSRTNLPKQFIKTFTGRSLFQNTLRIIADPKLFYPPYIVTNLKHKHLVKEQLEEESVSNAKIYLEPIPHSTAPAITIAALDIIKHDPNAIILVLSSDGNIKNPIAFTKILKEAAQIALTQHKFLLFSSKPTYAETGYGYINSGPILNKKKDLVPIYRINNFIEKPSSSKAEEYIETGYQWNMGIFLLPVKQYLNELEKFAPAIFTTCKNTVEASARHKETGYSWVTLDKETFSNCPTNSIDCALMEKTASAAVVKTDIGWHDIGSWQPFYEISSKDSDGNALSGNVISINNKNTHIHSTDNNRILAAIDIKNLTIVQTSNATLVFPRKSSQEIRKIISMLSPKLLHDPISYFSWGHTEIIKQDPNLKIKKIIIKPKHKLIAKGNSKAKHFIVIKGQVVFEFNNSRISLHRNQPIMLENNLDYTITNHTNKSIEIIKTETSIKRHSTSLTSLLPYNLSTLPANSNSIISRVRIGSGILSEATISSIKVGE